MMFEVYSKIRNKEKVAAIIPDFAELNRGEKDKDL